MFSSSSTVLASLLLVALVVLVLLTLSVDGAIHDHGHDHQYQYQPYHDDSAGASYYGSSGRHDGVAAHYARIGYAYAGGYGGGVNAMGGAGNDHHAGSSGSGRAAAAGGRGGGSGSSSGDDGDRDGDEGGTGAGHGHRSSSSSWSEVSVNVVDDAFTTACPRPTVVVYKGRRYTATASGEVLTIRDCPCTLTTTRSYTASDGGPVVSTSTVYAS